MQALRYELLTKCASVVRERQALEKSKYSYLGDVFSTHINLWTKSIMTTRKCSKPSRAQYWILSLLVGSTEDDISEIDESRMTNLKAVVESCHNTEFTPWENVIARVLRDGAFESRAFEGTSAHVSTLCDTILKVANAEEVTEENCNYTVFLMGLCTNNTVSVDEFIESCREASSDCDFT